MATSERKTRKMQIQGVDLQVTFIHSEDEILHVESIHVHQGWRNQDISALLSEDVKEVLKTNMAYTFTNHEA